MTTPDLYDLSVIAVIIAVLALLGAWGYLRQTRAAIRWNRLVMAAGTEAAALAWIDRINADTDRRMRMGLQELARRNVLPFRLVDRISRGPIKVSNEVEGT